MTKSIHVFLITLIATTLAVEVRVLTGMNIRGQVTQPDHDQKLVINSNNRYVYPHQQVP